MPVTTTALPNDGAVLDTLLSILGPRPAAVLDLGGGTGVYAVPLARNGHRVQVLDQSNDALWALARRAQAEGVGDRVQAEVADLDDLAGHVQAASADLVLCHRVLEYVDSPGATLTAAASALREGGLLSIVVANRPGAALGRVIAGRLDEAQAVLDGAQHGAVRFDLQSLTDLLEQTGLQAREVRGVGLLSALNPSASGGSQQALAARMSADHVLAQVAPLLHIVAGHSGHGS